MKFVLRPLNWRLAGIVGDVPFLFVRSPEDRVIDRGSLRGEKVHPSVYAYLTMSKAGGGRAGNSEMKERAVSFAVARRV